MLTTSVSLLALNHEQTINWPFYNVLLRLAPSKNYPGCILSGQAHIRGRKDEKGANNVCTVHIGMGGEIFWAGLWHWPGMKKSTSPRFMRWRRFYVIHANYSNGSVCYTSSSLSCGYLKWGFEQKTPHSYMFVWFSTLYSWMVFSVFFQCWYAMLRVAPGGVVDKGTSSPDQWASSPTGHTTQPNTLTGKT